jgi:hypothetical protein
MRGLASVLAPRRSPDVAEQEGASAAAVPVWPSLTPSLQLVTVHHAPSVRSRGTTSPAATLGSRGQSRTATSRDVSAARVGEQRGVITIAGVAAESSLGLGWDWV